MLKDKADKLQQKLLALTLEKSNEDFMMRSPWASLVVPFWPKGIFYNIIERVKDDIDAQINLSSKTGILSAMTPEQLVRFATYCVNTGSIYSSELLHVAEKLPHYFFRDVLFANPTSFARLDGCYRFIVPVLPTDLLEKWIEHGKVSEIFHWARWHQLPETRWIDLLFPNDNTPWEKVWREGNRSFITLNNDLLNIPGYLLDKIACYLKQSVDSGKLHSDYLSTFGERVLRHAHIASKMSEEVICDIIKSVPKENKMSILSHGAVFQKITTRNNAILVFDSMEPNDSYWYLGGSSYFLEELRTLSKKFPDLVPPAIEKLFADNEFIEVW